MTAIKIGVLPQDALLNQYKQAGAYTDCYYMDFPGRVTASEYIEAFYTTKLFKVERTLLGIFVGKPSNDSQAKLLANAEVAKFSAWSVEGRTDNQLLLCDFMGKTRSWLMCVIISGSKPSTRLFFGSAVVPKKSLDSGEMSFGVAFHFFKGFHKLYTRVLMASAFGVLTKSMR